jgi:hypothetical protein
MWFPSGSSYHYQFLPQTNFQLVDSAAKPLNAFGAAKRSVSGAGSNALFGSNASYMGNNASGRKALRKMAQNATGIHI